MKLLLKLWTIRSVSKSLEIYRSADGEILLENLYIELMDSLFRGEQVEPEEIE